MSRACDMNAKPIGHVLQLFYEAGTTHEIEKSSVWYLVESRDGIKTAHRARGAWAVYIYVSCVSRFYPLAIAEPGVPIDGHKWG